MIKLTSKDKQHLLALIAPSSLSGFIGALSALIVTVGVMIVFSFNISDIQQQLVAWQQKQPERTLTTPDQTLPENDRPTLAGSWPLLVVWSAIGLLTYMVAASIAHSIGHMNEIRRSLNYVNAPQRRSLLQITAEHIALRIVASIILIGLASFFIKQVLPYSISASHAAASDFISLTGPIYMVLSLAAIMVSLHIQTIFLRLALGRIRVFSEL